MSHVDGYFSSSSLLFGPSPSGRRWRARVGLTLALLLVTTFAVMLDRPTVAKAAASVTACPPSRVDVAAALATARFCGGRVEVESLKTETTRAWALPSGSIQAETSLGPVRFRGDDGEWVDVDMTLVRRPDGSVAPRAHPNRLVLAGAAGGSGEHDLASMRIDDQALTLGWRGALPEPVLAGTTATYPNVQPGVDLVVEATRTSFRTLLVARHRGAALGLSRIAMPWRTGTLTAVSVADGGLELRDAAGAVKAVVPPAEMWDARLGAGSGEPLRRAAMGMRVVARTGGRDLVVTPAAGFLADPTVVFPVTLDPSPAPFEPNFDAFVQTDYTSDQSGSTLLKLGYSDDGGSWTARSFMSFHYQDYLHGAYVQGATLSIYANHSWSCTAREWQAWETGYVTTTARWTNQPAWIQQVGSSTVTKGYSASCADQWVTIPVTGAFQATADGTWGTVNVGLRAPQALEDAQDHLTWKKFDSKEGTHAPTVSLTYSYRPTVAAMSTAPATQCVTGSGRPFLSTATPTLSAQILDAEGAAVTAEFEWWNVGGSKIGGAVVGPGGSGSTQSVGIPSGALGNGGNYMWRVRGNDGVAPGVTTGFWSGWCEFTVDTTAPTAAPGVSSSTYPQGWWAGGAGTAGSFTFTAGGVADVASYLYGLDTNPPTTSVNATGLGGGATVSVTPTSDGPHTLWVRSVDRAGNLSPLTGYQFNVGAGAVTTPRSGDLSAGKVTVSTAADTPVTGVTLQWRRGDADSWTTVPVADVTYAIGGGPLSSWPLAPSGGAFPKLNWNVEATVNAAEAGPDALDGPVQIRASLTGGSLPASSAVKFTLDRDRALAATAPIGPGAVNLLTGNLAVAATDVSVDAYGSDLTVARTLNTRQASATDNANMFGPGWVSGAVVADASAPYTSLTVTGSLVQVGLPDGATIGFAQHDGTNTTFDPEIGAESLRLTHTASPDQYVLSDLDGTAVTFTRISGAAAGLYHPTAVSTPGSGQTTTLSWQKVTVGGTDVVRPTQMLAPVPSGVTCTTLVKGCRALSFAYASSTTATGTAPSGWGDFLGRATQVSVTVWNPDTSAMATVVLSRYLYDSTGRLRAQWDPRLDWTDTSVTPPVTRHVGVEYTYDGAGMLTMITPAGREPWQLSYTTVPGDAGAGRISAVSRSALTAGTATTTVVYQVPVSGTGAPYDLSGTQATRWGQAEPPTDATAVFPPTQVPTGNPPTGVLPSSYEYATVTYTDPNGRALNTVTPGGYTATSWYDGFGNTVRTLSAANRDLALSASGSDTPAQEAALAARYSTVNTYSADGQELRDSLGPEHDAALPGGAVVRGRDHTVTTFDQGAPGGGPYHLPTTTVTSVQYTAAGGAILDADARTSTTGYDWTLRQPTISTVDPAGLALATRTSYDSVTGLAVSTTAPAGGATTNTPATRTTVYYRTGTGSGYTECDSHAEWANLPCRVQPGGQAGSGPELPVTVTTYDMFNQARVVTEKTSAGVLRTATTTYDGAARVSTVAVTGAGVTGTSVPTRKVVYDQASGVALRQQTLDGGGAVTAENVRGYDTLGRVTAYTDTDGNAATFTYDIASRPATVYDGKATRTLTYDGGSERRGLVTSIVDTQAGTFSSGGYDADGRLLSQTWPGGIVAATGYDETGTPRSRTYTKPGCGLPDCTLFTETVAASGHGQTRTRSSTLGGQIYTYDAAGRLTTVADTVAAACTTRQYGFNTASDRIGLTSYGPAGDGSCQTSTAASAATWTYDTADRVNTSGYVYDSLGRTTTIPAVDTGAPGGGNQTATYHVTDLVRTLTQGTRTTTYTLDVSGERIRSWTDNLTGSPVTHTNHYTGDGDSPCWTDEGGGAWTRPVADLSGLAAITTTLGTTATDWQLTDLHGDLVATIHNSDPGLTTTNGATEYGQPRNSSDVGARRYSWLARHQRAADTPAGMILMGVRLYNPTTGRFIQTDPVAGGSANAYDYCNASVPDCTDVDGKKPGGPGYNDCARYRRNSEARRQCLNNYQRRLKVLRRVHPGEYVQLSGCGVVCWGISITTDGLYWHFGGMGCCGFGLTFGNAGARPTQTMNGYWSICGSFWLGFCYTGTRLSGGSQRVVHGWGFSIGPKAGFFFGGMTSYPLIRW